MVICSRLLQASPQVFDAAVVFWVVWVSKDAPVDGKLDIDCGAKAFVIAVISPHCSVREGMPDIKTNRHRSRPRFGQSDC